VTLKVRQHIFGNKILTAVSQTALNAIFRTGFSTKVFWAR